MKREKKYGERDIYIKRERKMNGSVTNEVLIWPPTDRYGIRTGAREWIAVPFSRAHTSVNGCRVETCSNKFTIVHCLRPRVPLYVLPYAVRCDNEIPPRLYAIAGLPLRLPGCVHRPEPRRRTHRGHNRLSLSLEHEPHPGLRVDSPTRTSTHDDDGHLAKLSLACRTRGATGSSSGG